MQACNNQRGLKQTPSCINQDGKVFENDETLIAKNSTLIIVRKPLPKGQQKVWEEEEKISAAATAAMAMGGSAHSASSGGPGAAGFGGLGGDDADLSESDRISNMVANSSEMYDQKNWIKYGRKHMAGGGPPPAHYREEPTRFLDLFVRHIVIPFRG